MIPKEAIEKAIEGGWKAKLINSEVWKFTDTNSSSSGHALYHAEIVCDPSFWQALAKALQWGGVGPCEDCGKEHFNHASRCALCSEWLIGYDQECPNDCDTDDAPQLEYEYQAHRFYDLILTGGDTEKFWSEVLNKS